MSVNVNDYLSVISTDAATNTAVIKYTVICSTSGDSYNLYEQSGDFWVDGQYASSEYTLPRNSDTTVFEGTFTVGNASGRTINASYSFPTTPAGGTKEGGSSVTVPDIPRYANITEFKINSSGLNSLQIKWNADAAIDWLQYSLNGGNWVNANGNTFSINNLNPNTTYSVKIKVRRADSQLWTESNTINGKTKDIARITSAPDFNLGDAVRIVKTNPSGNQNIIRIETLNPTTTIVTRNQTTDDMTITFTDEELDALYKKTGNNSSLPVRFVVDTIGNVTYHDYTNKTCTLTGNQKTTKIKISGIWHRAKGKFKVSGVWHKAVIWKKEDGAWHRSI